MRFRLVLPLLLTALVAGASAEEYDALSAGAMDSIPSGASPPAGHVRLIVDVPEPGAVVEASTHMAEVRGTALAADQGASKYDVMLVIDVSWSTRSASGIDVNEDGVIGEDPHLGLVLPGEYPEDVRSTDPEDTILHAEVKAARLLIESLDRQRHRVGIVTFSGVVDPVTNMQVSPDQKDAWLELSLTHDHAKAHAALDRILEKGPHGATNFAAGIRLAMIELAGFSDAVSRPRPDAQRVMLFLTDGIPSFPAGRADTMDPGDIEAAVNAARAAHAAGIRINVYAIGPEALTAPKAAAEVARVTLGTYTPLLEPGAIIAALRAVSFANVEDVGIVNLTTRESAPDVRLNPDGSFVAFVPVREGRNRLLVNALGSNGSETNTELEIDFRLKAELDDRMRARDLARLRRINDELIRHLEAERIRREQRRQRMERELEIRAVSPE
jgi:Mg-chelatase subunit ChlD